MLDIKQFREYIIRPALFTIDAHSDAAEELVLGTALQESRLIYIKQLGDGPALGVFQMEPATHNDIWENYLAYQDALTQKVLTLAAPNGGDHPSPNELIGNLWYACAMCRVHYRRVSDPLPQAGDVPGMASYWKEFYNTHLGAGTEEEYEENWFSNMGGD
jgi:hypothetical protein